MITQNCTTVIHHAENKPTKTKVTFDLHCHREGEDGEWGALKIDMSTSDGNGGSAIMHLTHIIVGADWRERAAAIRQAFRSATLLRP